MKFRLLTLPLLAVILLTTECQKKVPPEPGPKVLKFAIQTAFNRNFHPVEDAYIINYQPLLRSIFSTLYKMNQDLKPYPFLIDREEVQGRSVIFHLKKNIKFSNGRPITSADAVWSIKSCLKYRLNPNPLYRLIEGGEAFFSGQQTDLPAITALSDRSFQITFTKPNVDFANYLSNSNLSVIPKGWTRDQKVFSGAYILDEEEKKANYVEVILKRNPYYIGKRSNLDKVCIHFYETRTFLDEAIRRGDPDIFLYNFYYNIPKSEYKYHYFKTPLSGHFLFLLNPSKGIFKEKRYRTFLKQYLLHTDFTKREDWDFATRAEKILPYGMAGYFVFQPFQAQNLSTLIPKERIKVRCYYVDFGIRRSLIPFLKEDLKKYNVELELISENWDTLSPRLRDGGFDLTAFYFMVDLPDSYHFYENLMYLSGDINPTGYQNPRAIELLNKYQDEPDELKRLKILAQLEKIAQEEAYVVPVLNSMCLLGYKDRLKNVKIDTFLTLPFEEFDIETRH